MIGKTAGFNGNLGSGVAYVRFDDGSVLLVESGFGIRQFVAAFGSLQAALGRAIEYDVDDLGRLVAFSPVEV